MAHRRASKDTPGDETLSEADQSAADRDQTASDSDQTAADRDQVQSDVDQAASDRDQAASDRDLGQSRVAEDRRAHDISEAERSEGTLDRRFTTRVRAQIGAERDEEATRRDESARQRDLNADERDRSAETSDDDAGELAELDPADSRTTIARQIFAGARKRGAEQRAKSAEDRRRAAQDREAAAADRVRLIAEIDRLNVDELTGAHGRAAGKPILIHEIRHAQRSGEPLTLAFLDVDGLKAINDRRGHREGDALLQHAVTELRARLRPTDPIVRWGGDEFVCTMSKTGPQAARELLAEVAGAVERACPGGGASGGLATVERGDTIADVLERADQDLIEHRRQSRGEPSS